jgi:hypothetical protein
MCPRLLGCEVGRVRESPDGAAPVFNPSGGGSCLQPPSPGLGEESTGGLHGVTVPGIPQGLAQS